MLRQCGGTAAGISDIKSDRRYRKGCVMTDQERLKIAQDKKAKLEAELEYWESVIHSLEKANNWEILLKWNM